jgi:hypothetical protein
LPAHPVRAPLTASSSCDVGLDDADAAHNDIDQMTSDQLPFCIDARRVRLRCDSAFGELDNNKQPTAA